MERIPFDIKYRPEIEAGKYLVVTRDGGEVKIDRWDWPDEDYPIVAYIIGGECHHTYTDKGEFDKGEHNNIDLFLVPNPDYKEPTTTCSTSVDWDAFRREAAKDFVSAILSNSTLVDDQPWKHRVNVIGVGVAYADELIKQLREEKK